MKNTYIALSIVVAVIVGVVIGSTYSKSQVTVGAASPSGTYQSVLATAQQTILTSGVNTSTGSFSVYNASNDRAVIDAYAYCTGVAAETQNNIWGITAATSSAATGSNTAYAVNLTLATTSAVLYVASTTYTTSGTGVAAGNELWPANTYLVFTFNATDTAVCTTGVKYLQL